MKDSPPANFLGRDITNESVMFSSLAAIRSVLETVARAVLCGDLDYRVANSGILAATQAARTFALESEIADRERRANSNLSDEELEEALRQWRRNLIGEAHGALVKPRNGEQAS